MTKITNIRQDRASPAMAKSVQLACPKCGTLCEAVFPYGSTNEDKVRIRHEVINEHVKVCTAATGEVLRVWGVEFPRT
jgi:hypothetical protein